MSCTLVFEVGNAALLEAVVQNALTGAYLNDATVTATVTDSADVPVAGETWPATLAYVAASNGIYRKQLSNSLAVIAGQPYKATILITPLTGAPRILIYDVVVVEPGCSAQVSSSSPASPAYSAPNTLTLLNQAEAAYHSLVTGSMARVVVDQNGERVEFTATRRGELLLYIQSLRSALNPTPFYGTPAGVIF